MKPRYISIIAALLLVLAMAGAVLNHMTVMTLADNETPKVHDDTTTVARKAAANASDGDGDLSAFTLDDADGPEGFVPTMMTDLQSADPTSGMQFIAPPTANSRGTATLDYPLLMPPARNGMQPQVSLQYSSDSGSGWLGEGWDIPIPTITVDTRWGVPRYSSNYESETYLLSGQMLAFADASGNMHVSHRGEPQQRGTDSLRHFFPRREGSFSTIIRHGSSPSDYWWEVKDRRGTRYVYGGTENSRLYGTFMGTDGQERTVIAEWRLSEVKEIHGDYMRYYYRHAQESAFPSFSCNALYLSRIEAGHEERPLPHTIVTFTGQSTKTVKRNHARYGFLTSSNELLDSIKVNFLGRPLRSYVFSYADGAFCRKLLASVSQCDQAGTVVASHHFDYHNQVFPLNGSNDSLYIFGRKDTLNTFTDIPGNFLSGLAGHGKPTALGGNKGTAYGGAAYVGVGTGLGIDKLLTAGASVSYGQNQTDGISTLADLNGDGLPDKVFVKDGILCSRPQVVVNGVASFGDTIHVNRSSFAKTKTISYGAGVKAHGILPKVSAGLDYGHTKSETKVYFSDVNGDGLADLVENGRVWFNNLSDGRPVFTQSSNDTPNPLSGITVMDTVGAWEEMKSERDSLLKYSPMQDVVRMWRAPRTGYVSVKNNIQLLNVSSDDDGTPDGIVAKVQLNELPKRTITKGATNHTNTQTTNTYHVDAGDVLYFRLQSGVNLMSNGSCDRVLWPVTITYTSGDTITDANGYNNRIFKSSQGNIVSSRVQFPVPDGTTCVIVGGHFRKPVTTDDIQLRVYTTGNIGSSRTPSGLLTRNWNTAYNGTVNIPISSSAQLDYVECEVYSTSNVAWEDVKWIPEITFVSGTDSTTMTIPALSHVYVDERARGYVYSSSVRDTVYVVPYIPSGQSPHFTLTVKKRNTLVYKKVYPSQMANVPVIIEPNTPYHITISCDEANATILGNQPMVSIGSQNVIMQRRDRNNSDTMSGGNPANEGVTADELENLVRNAGTSTYANYDVYVDSLATSSSGPSWRGWGRFVYNSANSRFGRVIATDSLFLPRNSDEASQRHWPYVSMSVSADNNILRWRGSKEDIYICGDTVSSARLMANNVRPEHPLVAMRNQSVSSGEAVAPSLVSKGYSLSLMGSGATEILPNITFSGSLSAAGGRGHTVISYIDMNGDGYPDYVSNKDIRYTSSLGVLSGEKIAASGMKTANFGTSAGSGGYAMLSHTASPTNNGTHQLAGTTAVSREASVNRNSESKSMTGDEAETLVEKGMENIHDTVTLNLNGLNIEGNVDHAVSQYLDINGDGLPDRVYDDGQICLNLGYSFTGKLSPAGMQNGIEVSKTTTASLGLGIDLKASSFAAGVSSSIATTAEQHCYTDINGDGLPDLLRVDNGNIAAWQNLGYGFGNKIPIASLESLSRNKATTASANASVTFTVHPFGVKVAITPSAYIATSVSQPYFGLRDFDGDGFLDILSSSTEDTIYVTHSAIGCTNYLSKVTNSLGGSFTIDYTRSAATSSHPGGKWVMSEVTVDDGIHDDGPCPKTRFEYSGGVYDRREREFLGFGRVLTRQLDSENGDALYRTLTETYDVSSYHTLGLPLGTLLTDAQGHKYLRTQNTYYRYGITHQGSSQYYKFTLNAASADCSVLYVPLKFTQSWHYEGGTDSVTVGQKWHSYYVSATSARGELMYQKISSKGTLNENGDGACDYRYYFTYRNYSSSHVYSMLLAAYVYKSSSSTVMRKCIYNYKSACPVDLSSKTLYINTNQAVTNYTTDLHGNITKITLPTNASGQRQEYTYTYDNTMGMYPTSVTDKFHCTSTSCYDYRYGTLICQIDINNNEFYIYIDSLGRMTGARGPYDSADSLAIEVQYTPFAVSNAHGITSPAYALTKHHCRNAETGNSTIITRTIAHVDGFGRSVQVKKDGVITENESQQHVLICSGRVVYDALGRAIQSWHPTTTSTSALTSFNTAFDIVTPTNTSYDVLDRPTSVILPDGATTTTAYTISSNLRKSLVTDALGNQKATYADGAGRIVREEMLNGPDGVITTQFTYDELGQLKTVTDNEGNVTSYLYDMAGRVTDITHPASGTSHFAYDNLGNVSWRQTQNIGPSLKMIRYSYEYDRLKSITYPDHPENNVAFTYGTDGMSQELLNNHNGLGRLLLREDATGATEYFYDSYGNVKTERRTLVVPNFVNDSCGIVTTFDMDYSYDNFGRIIKMTYPDGQDVEYAYDAGGNLQKVRNGTQGGFFVSHIGYDKFGQRTSMLLGDGTTTCYSYSPERRWLQGLNVSNSSQSLVNNVYVFDPVGNINQATIGQTTHSYQYDDLYRLTSASGNYLAGNANYNLTMTYDNLWRITSKQQSLYQNGVIANGQLYSGYHLNYDYQTETPGHHFQLESIYDEHYRSNTGVNGQRQTRHRFNYDDNGNLIYESTARMRADGQYDERMQERRLLWDEENRLLALSENGYVSNYFYDADGERTIKMHGANSAVFADGLLINDSTNYNRYVLYVNPFFTVTSDSLYYRHIYMGGERFLTQVGKYYNLFGNFENNSSMAGNSFNTDYAGAYQGKWQTLCDVYWQRYDSLGVTHNGVEPPVSKSAGYVQQGRLTDPGEENGIMTRSSDGSYSSNEDEGYLIEPEDELEQSAEDDESELSEDDSVASEDETDEPLGLGSDTESMDLSPIPLRQSIFVAADGPAESYYYHKDYLGSSSIITNENGEVTQRIEYLPYGEVFLEQNNTNWNTPYKFNGKELDEETGLYYYGARYYDPRLSLWLGTDPMQEKYAGITTYCYTMGSPMKYMDPDGRVVISPNQNDREKLLGLINSIASDTYGFNDSGYLYKVMKGKPHSMFYHQKYSSTYSFYLDEAINSENTAFLYLGENVTINSKNYNVDNDFGGGVSIIDNQTKTSNTYISGNPYDKLLAKNQSVVDFVWGESSGERHFMPPLTGYYIKENSDMILCHEIVSHIAPWMILENSKNGIENENNVRMEIGLDLRFVNLKHDKYNYNSAIVTTDN